MKIAIAAALFIGSLALVGTGDYEEAKASHYRYCEMVQIWNETNGDAGWPPYKGEC